MANEVRLIDANGRYTLHASDNTDYSLLFRNGIICVENELGHCVCEFYADDAPTVDAVEVVHGRWEERPLDNFRKYEVKCSECGFIGIGNYDQYLEPTDFNYCPNCGAKMDGGNDDA